MPGKFITFGKTPFGEGEKPAALGDGTDRRGEDPVEEIHEVVEIINRGGAVSGEGRGLHITGVELWRVVNMQHVVRQRLQGREIIGTNEAVRIEILLHPRVPPVDGNGVHMQRINQLFCGPARAKTIFKGDVEAIGADPIDLPLVTIFLGNAKPGVVQGGPG